jgi:prepilin-type processing-associated H-X9-DG protein/prepilin-type N-terminal cleavage/methylation domain-containing protein
MPLEWRRNARRCRPVLTAVTAKAFTLVELLVVIGIIALLISLLIPSLTVARQAAVRTVCMSRLQQMMLGAQMHLMDHKGWYPLTGVLSGMQPEELNDPNSSKYDYFSYPFAGLTRMIAPVTVSLATELSAKQAQFVLSNANIGTAETDDRGFIRNFLCPAQSPTTSELIQLPMLYIDKDPAVGYIWYTESQSYIYNEAILGCGDYNSGGASGPVNRLGRCMGQYNLIHQPGRTMFAADGLMGSIYENRFPYQTGRGMCSVYNMVADPPVTMADALTGIGQKAGDPQNFDLYRHQGKINIAFCDCHVETHNITAKDLTNVFLLAP